VLADARGDDRFALGQSSEQLDGMLRHDDLIDVALEEFAHNCDCKTSSVTR